MAVRVDCQIALFLTHSAFQEHSDYERRDFEKTINLPDIPCIGSTLKIGTAHEMDVHTIKYVMECGDYISPLPLCRASKSDNFKDMKSLKKYALRLLTEGWKEKEN